MKRWIQLVAKAYPRAWRSRYGREFEAFLEDLNPRWSDLFDVLRGAVMMQARSLWSYWKLGTVVALAGVAIAIAASFAGPKEYVSTAVMRPVHPGRVPFETLDEIAERWQEATSRGSLSEIIQRPTLDLYRGKRNRIPLEDVIEQMKNDLRIDITPSDASLRFRISFAYPDPRKARAVVAALTAKVAAPNYRFMHKAELPADAPELQFQVVTPANLPDTPAKPDLLTFVAYGLGCGLLAGFLTVLLRWRAGWTLTMLAFGVAGCLVLGGLSFLLPNWYTSRSAIRVAPLPRTDGSRRLMSDDEMKNWLRRKQDQLLSDASLSEIMLRPTLNLYKSQRQRDTIEQTVKEMRRRITFEARSNSLVVFTFTYPDRVKAQQVVAALVGKLTDSAFRETLIVPAAEKPVQYRYSNPEACIGKTGDDYVSCIAALAPAGVFATPPPLGIRRTPLELIDILDPASLPEAPVGPNRFFLGITGLLVGLFLGAYLLQTRRRPSTA
jgi:hypothetical protein